ncbi:MAG TPA: PRC-barrel domain-containing protein [Polyangiales bacterium]
MYQTMIRSLWMCALALGVHGVALAQAPPVAGRATVGVTVAETEFVATGWRASKLVGAEVWNDHGDKIGKVDDVIVAPDGKLSYAILDVGGFLGIRAHRVAIPITQFQLSRTYNAVLPGASKAMLKSLPEFRYAS